MKKIALIALLLCICGQVFAQSVIYVSATGNDENNGLTEATALKSLDAAALIAIVKGAKVIVIGTLTTANAMLYEKGRDSLFTFVGTNDSPMLIISGKPGATGAERAVLSGRGAESKIICIVAIATDANIRFENIEISGLNNKDSGGILVDKGGRVTLGQGAVVRGNDVGVAVFNGNCILDGGEVRDNASMGVGISENGVLTMRSGAVRDNKNTGVFVSKGGRFTMSGGTITGNRSDVRGAGVLVATGGRFDQTGGDVSGNIAPQNPNIYRQSGALGSSSSGSGSSGSSSSSSSSSSGSSSSSKSSSDFDFNFIFFSGVYLQGWHQNTFTFGIPLLLGVELDFGNVMSLALLGEAGGGIGYPYLLEYNFGGMAELYFADKMFGFGVGFGSSNMLMPWGDGLLDTGSSYDYDYDYEPVPFDVKSTYIRFALILRKDGKTSIFAQRYANGDWGFGIQFTTDLDTF